jgi:hypothetical protein
MTSKTPPPRRPRNTTPAAAAKTTSDTPEEVKGQEALPVDQGDERDVQLAELRAELEALRNPPPPPEPAEPADPRDAAIAELRAELAAIRSTPEGANAELAKAFAALQAQVTAMQNGQGLVPLPEPGTPDPLLYFARLANGDIIEVPHPNTTHHHVDGLGAVPITGFWLKSAEALQNAPA